MKNIIFSTGAENTNESSAKMTERITKGLMEYFNLDKVQEIEEVGEIDNLPSLKLLDELAQKGYKFTVQPKTSRNGICYFWIYATLKGEDREEFSLYVNNEILPIFLAILLGQQVDISGINANDLDTFNAEVQNFELEMYKAERAQGKSMRKTHTVTGQTFSSSYPKGVIVYKPYLNPELKKFINT